MKMTSSDLKIALLPLNINWENKESNLSCLRDCFKNLHPETDVVILPETFSTGFPVGKIKDDVRKVAERNTGSTIDLIKELASEHHVAICGSYIADTGGSLYNRVFFIEPSGEEYFEDKKHLFTMAGEDKIFSKGRKRLSVRFRGWNLALVVCYDIRFPVWCRNVNNEYDALIVIANWPAVRVGAWNILLPARAVENEAYVCAVNCKGTDDKGFEYDGSSGVFDFKGKKVSVLSDESPFIYATLSRDRLDSFRKKFPAWKDADLFIIKA